MPNPNFQTWGCSIDPETFAASRPFAAPITEAEDWLTLTRLLLGFRHDKVVPLLKSGQCAAAHVRKTGPSALFARWPFQAGQLTIRVNLGAPPDTAWRMPNAQIRLNDGTAPWAFAAEVHR